MFRHRFVFLLLIISSSSFCISAQTPREAVEAFMQGTRNYEEGHFDRAIDFFTTAIQLSSHPGPTKIVRGKSYRLNDSSDTNTEPDNVTIVEPFVANAYSRRGVARYKKADFNVALADFDRAIRISPRFAGA